MQTGEIDFHAMPQEFVYWNRGVEMSKTVMNNRYKIGHLIDKPDQSDKTDFSIFFINNFKIILIILIGYYLTRFLIYLYFKSVKSKFNFFDLFLIELRNGSKVSKISLIILFFNFFLFINLSLLSNSIKTDKVIVKTDQIIDSFDELDRSSKILAYFEDQGHIFTQAPNRSFLYRFYQKKFKKNKIFLFSSKKFENFAELLEIAQRIGFDNFLFIAERTRIYPTYKFISKYLTNYHLWIRSTAFFEELCFLYLNPNLDEKKKRILYSGYNFYL